MVAAPSPHSQLWRWELQKQLVEMNTTLTIGGAANCSMEIGRTDGVASTPYIDFHSGAVLTDFDSRLMGSGGNGAVGQGTLVVVAAALTPYSTNTTDLGTAALRWKTVYTSDLSLKNDVGDWTIVEGADDLFITNNRTGKAYKFALIEVV